MEAIQNALGSQGAMQLGAAGVGAFLGWFSADELKAVIQRNPWAPPLIGAAGGVVAYNVLMRRGIL